MDRSSTLDAVDLESSRFLVAVSAGAETLDRSVDTCPGWDVAQLVGHLGYIYGRVAFVVSTRRTEAPERSQLPTAPDGEACVGWFAEQREAMLAALGDRRRRSPGVELDREQPRPGQLLGTPHGPRDSHPPRRCRARPGRSHPPTRAPTVAADTVAEFFDLIFPLFEEALVDAGAGGSLHLHATDVPGAEWTVIPRRGGSVVTREHAKADVALRGDAFELACWAWGRLPTSRLEVFGDPLVADRFQEVVQA